MTIETGVPEKVRKRKLALVSGASLAMFGLVVSAGCGTQPGNASEGTRPATIHADEKTHPASVPASVRGTTTKTASGKVVRTTIDLTKLPKGSVPKVPWLAEGVIHDGAKEIRLPQTMSNAVGLRPMGRGYVVAYSLDELTLKYAWLDTDGKVKRHFPGLPVMDPAGNQVAYADEQVQGKTVLVLLDLRTGKTRQTSTALLPRHRPVGFASDPEGPGAERILLADRGGEGGDPLRTGVWDPATGKVALFSYATVSRVARGVFVGSTAAGCSGLYDLHGQEFWKFCDRSTPGLTGDGVYAFGSSGDRDHSKLLVRQAESGAPAFDLSGVYTEPMAALASERDGSIVFPAEDAETGERGGLVRCAPTGKCELASELTDPMKTPILAD